MMAVIIIVVVFLIIAIIVICEKVSYDEGVGRQGKREDERMKGGEKTRK